ncbi:MAG: biopolymer transporter ExbD [Bacteroidota bacterium]
MAKKSVKDRMSNEINAGSMADIAFLLLIFFLVTTTIAEDKGVLVRLPPWSEEPPPTLKFKTRNVYSILVNANNDLLVRGEPKELAGLREGVKEFILNPNKRDDYSETPNDAIVSLKNDRGTNYETYLEVYNEVKAAYNELRNEESERQFGKLYEFLERDQKKKVNEAIPMKLSEAEPTSFGEE